MLLPHQLPHSGYPKGTIHDSIRELVPQNLNAAFSYAVQKTRVSTALKLPSLVLVEAIAGLAVVVGVQAVGISR